jgi:Asp-tRNA(Asn)/Glu-tRNA(Gln) amidotransferase A subunit family amidase
MLAGSPGAMFQDVSGQAANLIGYAAISPVRLPSNPAWTALGTPAVAIPMPVADSLPLGLQLTAAHGQDARVLQAAASVEKLLRVKTA